MRKPRSRLNGEQEMQTGQTATNDSYNSCCGHATELTPRERTCDEQSRTGNQGAVGPPCETLRPRRVSLGVVPEAVSEGPLGPRRRTHPRSGRRNGAQHRLLPGQGPGHGDGSLRGHAEEGAGARPRAECGCHLRGGGSLQPSLRRRQPSTRPWRPSSSAPCRTRLRACGRWAA